MRYLFVLVVLLVAACAPRASTAVPILSSPQAVQAEQTANIAFHRMEIGFIQTGEYTTNALLELALPEGVRWTLQDFSSSAYELSFTSDEVAGVAWLVSPGGVRAVTR